MQQQQKLSPTFGRLWILNKRSQGPKKEVRGFEPKIS